MTTTNNNTSEIINAVCPCCGKPLDYYKQQLHPKSTRTPHWVGTCRTQGCDFELVTLVDENWTRIINDSEFAAQYRGMNAELVARMGK